MSNRRTRRSLPHANSILAYLHPIFLTCKLLGCHPFDVDLRPTQFGQVQSVFCFVLMVSAAICYVFSVFQKPEVDVTSTIIHTSTYALIVSATLLITVTTLIKVKRLKDLVILADEIDQKMWNNGIMYFYDNKRLKWEIFVKFSLRVILMVYDWKVHQQSFYKIYGPSALLSVNYSYFVLAGVEIQFLSVMSVLKKHLRILKESLDSASRKSNFADSSVELFCDLSHMADKLSEWFSFQLLLVTSFVFFVGTLDLNIMFTGLVSFLDPLPPQIIKFISSALWLFLRVHMLCEMLYFCNGTENEAQEFNEILSKQLILGQINDRMGLLDFHFAVKPGISFWAHHFYRMDNALLLSMLSSSLTFVIIIIQAQPQMAGVDCSMFEKYNTSRADLFIKYMQNYSLH